MIAALRSMPRCPHDLTVPSQALKDACAKLDADMRDPRSCGFDSSHSGTTACVALFAGSQLLVANTGEMPMECAGLAHSVCHAVYIPWWRPLTPMLDPLTARDDARVLQSQCCASVVLMARRHCFAKGAKGRQSCGPTLIAEFLHCERIRNGATGLA